MGRLYRKPRTIICEGCGVEVVTAGTQTKWCKECAEKQRKIDWAKYKAKKKLEKPADVKSNDINFHDSPEEIQMCLSCKRPTCRNCLEYQKNQLPYKKKV